VSSVPAAGAGLAPAPASPAAGRRRARKRAGWRGRLTVLAFLSPWLVGFCVFFGYPLVMSAWLSLHSYDLLTSPRWVGLANYRYLLGEDPQIWPAVRNTLWLIVVAVPCTVLFAFGIAVLLTRARTGAGLFRTIFYLPALVPPVAATLGFVYLLNPATGPVNIILQWIGIEGPLWFNDPGWSKPSLVLLGMWGVGTTMIIFLAAILDVPQHLYESAELDGAGALRRLRWVTLPTISPVILFAVVLGVIGALQYFTQAHVAASVAAGSAIQGGTTTTIEIGYPEGSTLFYPILVYNHGFRYFNMGYASAMAMLLLVVAFAVTAIIIWNTRRLVHYHGAAR
jgi:multiple sugar transport system permease protein